LLPGKGGGDEEEGAQEEGTGVGCCGRHGGAPVGGGSGPGKVGCIGARGQGSATAATRSPHVLLAPSGRYF